MPEITPPNLADAGLDVNTHFARARNAMVARADFGGLFVDYYLHLGANAMKPAAEHDTLFKRALVAFVLHCASRPRNEITAWTINFQEPRVNLFLTGDNELGTVTGRIFDQNVKELPENIFYSDVVRGRGEKRRSAVTFSGADPILAAEKFYTQSEQRVARYFQVAEEEWVMVTEHPDCDMEWFKALTTDGARDMPAKEPLGFLEKRVCRWHCGCNQAKLMEVLAPAMRNDPTALFQDDLKIEIRCPRCAGRHAITREAMEAFVAGNK
ncbi:MAG: disulfide bond chaperone [Opitutaceae bacterium]|nr:disulfide bond chaperone [Opitutaceae bacterium]